MEQVAAWRLSAPMDRFEALGKVYNDRGVHIDILKLGEPQWSDAEIDYAFQAAKAVGTSPRSNPHPKGKSVNDCLPCERDSPPADIERRIREGARPPETPQGGSRVAVGRKDTPALSTV